MSFVEERRVLTREKRLSALSNYHGTLEALIDEASGAEIKQKIRTFAQIYKDEIINAFEVLAKIEDAVIIVNGAIGCAGIGIERNPYPEYVWYSTNLAERDTILGGDDKLREAILRAYEEKHPKAIFIIGTPVVAINNDDINSVIFEMEEEIGIPVISIYTDGFKTKTPVTGYDIVTHSLLKYLVNIEPAEKGDFINVISFSEKADDVAAIAEILKELDIKYQVIPAFSNIREIQRASSAKASIVLNPEEGEYLAEELRDVFGVPYLETEVPIGYRETENFLIRLSRFLGVEERTAAYIDKQREKITEVYDPALLASKKIFIDATLSKIPAYAKMFVKYSGEVIGFSSGFIDLANRKQLKKLDFLAKSTIAMIGNGQNFEKANALAKSGADFYVTEECGGEFAIAEGVAVVSLKNTVTYGFLGVISIIKAIRKAVILKRLYERQSIYKDSWKKKSGNWYVKQEVS